MAEQSGSNQHSESTQQGESGGQGAGEEELSYEAAREELVDVVRRLEAGGISLEESLALWERGEQLARTCQQWLEGAREKLDAAIAADPE